MQSLLASSLNSFLETDETLKSKILDYKVYNIDKR